MNKERAKELLPIIEAFVNGKVIEYLFVGEWRVATCPEWTPGVKYRIRQEPKLVPFTFEDNLSFRDKWFKDKQNKQMLVKIYSINRRDGEILIGEEWVTYKQFLDEYIFEDGSPCGKYINE